MEQAIVFIDDNFRGLHRHLFANEPDFAISDELNFNDNISSIIIVEGIWQFYEDSIYNGQSGNPLGPGLYRLSDLQSNGLQSDSISSARIVTPQTPPAQNQSGTGLTKVGFGSSGSGQPPRRKVLGKGK